MVYQEFIRDHLAWISPAATKVYLGLLSYARNGTGSCRPSRTALAALTGLSEKTVTTAVAELKFKGIIAVDRAYDSRGQAPNIVTILDHADESEKVKTSPTGSKVKVNGIPPQGYKTSPELDVLKLDGFSSTNVEERAEARRLSKDERTKKRLALWKGYLNGLGLDEQSPSAASMKPAAFRSLAAPIVDAPEMNSATMTTLARWAKGYVKAWKATPPTVTECVNLYDYWNGLGRPRDYKPEHDPKFRQPGKFSPLPEKPLTPAEAERRWLDHLRTPDAWDGTERSKYGGKFGAENLARDIAASERALKEME